MRYLRVAQKAGRKETHDQFGIIFEQNKLDLSRDGIEQQTA